MMQYAIILATVAVMAHAQRSPYAGSVNRGYPQVLPQYLPSVPNEIDSNADVGNRIGQDSKGSTGSGGADSYVPYDPYNDQRLLDIIATWPKDKQPFWYLNRKQIRDHLGDSPSARSNSGRPFYAGRR